MLSILKLNLMFVSINKNTVGRNSEANKKEVGEILPLCRLCGTVKSLWDPQSLVIYNFGSYLLNHIQTGNIKCLVLT